jgi:hypothetical protein
VVDETEPGGESDLRRRAAWLLGTLAIVAVLLIVVMTKVIGTDSGSSDPQGPGALDSAIAAQATATTPHSSSAKATHRRTKTPPSSSAAGRITCPGSETCVLDGDVGRGVAAINAYRTQHGQPAVPGKVSTAAQTCAVQNGNGCSGGWAETEVAKANGALAVQKILQFGRLLDPNVKNFEIGWAYDPGAKMYYFAIIRND